MGIYSAIPLFFTPNTTGSGLVNGSGFIVHGNNTTLSGGPMYDPELPQLYGSYINKPIDNYVLRSIESDRKNAAATSYITPSVPYLEDNIQIASLDSLLFFNYGVILTLAVRHAIISLIAELNIISIDNITSYIVPTQRDHEDLYTFLRSNEREDDSLEAFIDVEFTYKVSQIFTKGPYIYAAVNKGLEIFNIETQTSLYIKKIPGAKIKTVWGNDTTLFIGSDNGLFYIYYYELHDDYINSIIKNSFLLKSPSINYIHGSDNNELLVTTSSGLEYFNWSGNQLIKSNTNVENASKCFLVGDCAYYFTTTTISGEPFWSLNKKKNLLTDWEVPTKSFTTGDVFTLSTSLTDLYVTEKTTTSGNNTIFCATTSGIYVIDEDENKKVIYYTG
jgi:hypothetical protein